jgi:hypothetical protein
MMLKDCPLIVQTEDGEISMYRERSFPIIVVLFSLSDGHHQQHDFTLLFYPRSASKA